MIDPEVQLDDGVGRARKVTAPMWMRRAEAGWKRVLVHVGLDFIALGVFLFILFGLVIAYDGKLKLVDGSVVWPSIVLLVIVLVSLATHAGELRSGDAATRRQILQGVMGSVRDWLPIILLILVYENLRGLTGLIRPDSIDAELYHLDVALFGVEPSVWIQRFASPWLTDYFAFAYTLYFILPLTLATTLAVRKKRDDFRELMVAIVIVQYTGFLLYIIFPAGPPRFAIAALFDPPKLHGIFGFYELTQGAFDGLNPVKVHASFPSLHCALSSLALLYAFRFRESVGGRGLFWLFVPLAASLWTATVYLRHHWLVDVFAGQALALVVFTVTPWLRRRYDALREAVLAREGAA